MKNQQLFLASWKKWGHRANQCPQNLERPTDKYRESQLNRANTQEHKSLQEPAPRKGNLNLTDERLEAPQRHIWEIKTKGTPSHSGDCTLLWISPPVVQLGSYNGYWRKIAFCLWLGTRKSRHFEKWQRALLNRASAHGRNYLTGALPAGVLLHLGKRSKYTTPAASNHSIPLKRKGLENEEPVWGSHPRSTNPLKDWDLLMGL